ncbi:signal peptidase II [Mogibacterium pumilum]|uniref:Lipoprotein signal peptidase n=1 Tax=Mogibacterium pumilum TaxID=86332 RepID=A0A223ATZ5_9FIRM|nr:signal peptidase II [Mogibacterium pumilum]ASS38448.1 signal peptidase II [Mogibacterium pumilum]
MMLVIIASGLLVIDQITKFAVRSRMEIGETLPVFRGVLDFTYVQNRGAAFSLFQNSQLVTVILPIITMIAGVLFLLHLRKNKEKLAEFGVLLIMSGGIGNLIDRTVLGFVTDMISVGNFPVFNVADICVTVGCAILILWVIIGDRKDA